MKIENIKAAFAEHNENEKKQKENPDGTSTKPFFLNLVQTQVCFF